MSYDITQKVKVTNPASNVDWYYGGENGYWDSVAAALEGVPSAVRQKGKTVAVADGSGGVVEYWWKAGVRDEDLVFKTGLSSTMVSDTTHVTTFVNVEGLTSITIPRLLHKKGVNPLVQCYVNNVLTLMDISNDGSGNITVAWAKSDDLRDFDVLNVYIIASKRGFVYEGELGDNSFIVSAQSHECGEHPMVQVWYGNKLESVLIDITNSGGDVTVSWGEEVEVSHEKKIVALFTEGVYVGESFKNVDGQTELVIDKYANGIGDAPLVLCYCGNEVVLADVINEEDDLVVTWRYAEEVSASAPLVVVVGCELTTEELGADDLARVAWTGSYNDLKDKPVFVATYTNVNERTYLVIPEAAHKCGKEVTVQCKVNGSLVFTDIHIDERGDVYVNWSSASFVSVERPLTVYIFGYKVKSKCVDEKKNVADYNEPSQDSGGEDEGGGEVTPVVPPTPIVPTGKIKAVLTMTDFYSEDVIDVFEQYFDKQSVVSLVDFDGWGAYSDKYEYNDESFTLGNSDVRLQISVKGKPYALRYTLFLEKEGEDTIAIYGTVEDGGVYNVAVSMNDIAYVNPWTHQTTRVEDSVVREWSISPNMGEMMSGNLYIMNGGYVGSIMLTCYITEGEF